MNEGARPTEVQAVKCCVACGTRFTGSDARFCPFDGEALVAASASADPLLGTVIGVVMSFVLMRFSVLNDIVNPLAIAANAIPKV